MDINVGTVVIEDIEDLKLYERNTKVHTTEQIDQIAESMKKFGFNDPIGVTVDKVIVEGHGRYLAAKKLGLERVPCVVLDLTEEQEKGYRIAHNQLTLDTGFNMRGLADHMQEIGATVDEMSVIGVTNDEQVLFSKENRQSHEGETNALGSTDYSSLLDIQKSSIKFETEEQYARWGRFLMALKMTYPSAETIAQRLMLFLGDKKYHD